MIADSITFHISRDEDSQLLVASWDNPRGSRITTQGKSLAELEAMIHEAVDCHFDEGQKPATVRLHFVSNIVETVS